MAWILRDGQVAVAICGIIFEIVVDSQSLRGSGELLMKDGFFRVCCAVPDVKVADCEYNVENILSLIFKANEKEVSLIVFPELCVTAYTCADLFLKKSLLEKAKESVFYIAKKTAKLDMIIVVGLPFTDGFDVYNCAAIIYHGEILGLVPKTNLPNYLQYYEHRYFSEPKKNKFIVLNKKEIPFGRDLIFACRNIPELKFGVEICEDLWVPTPPSAKLAKLGASIILNLSASDEFLGKFQKRRSLIKNQSERLSCAYVYSNAGPGESSADLIYAGHSIICENGVVLGESEKFKTGLTIAEIDLQLLEAERIHEKFQSEGPNYVIHFDFPVKKINLTRKFSKHPLIPLESYNNLNELCEDTLSFQSEALKARLKSINSKKVVLGVSGGLDSTLALCVIVRTFDNLEIDRKNIIAVTLPCFGTSSKTKNNAILLAKELGVTLREISIEKSVLMHFEDIGHDKDVHDFVFENSQARERTQVLMDIANKESALVIGTGDLSELALGFMTYNGDHMSMYNINCAVPKTLIKALLSYESNKFGKNLKDTINNIINTPISPELLPPKGLQTQQITEDILGPYELHDFFLYYFLKFGFKLNKVLRIAEIAFYDIYNKDEIKRCLDIFIKSFFKNQFKRSCVPDGPKIGEFSLSPRSSFRMPSDAKAAFLE